MTPALTDPHPSPRVEIPVPKVSSPKALKAAKQPKPAPPQAAEREVLYPEVGVNVYCLGSDLGPLTQTVAKTILDWQTEAEIRARLVADGHDEFAAEGARLKVEVDGVVVPQTLVDGTGAKVWCLRNSTNREYTDSWARELCQDILQGNWKFNLENVIVSRTGVVTSGQHRLIGFVLACQSWAESPESYPHWAAEPALETLVALGGSDDPTVLRTVDNVKPRSLGDVFFTSPTFSDLDRDGKKLASKMLASAVNRLWQRTRAGEQGGLKYQTHSQSVEFLAKHKRLEEAVRHIFEENKGTRPLSNLDLQPGDCAALMYLMAVGNTDIDGGYLQDRSEATVDLSLWDTAAAYWSRLAKRDGSVRGVVSGLAGLVDPDTGGYGRWAEKSTVLCLGFAAFAERGKVVEADVGLIYATDDEGVRHLTPECLTSGTAGGIDQGPPVPKVREDKADEAEAAKNAKDATRKKLSDQADATAKGDGKDARKEFADLKAAHPGRLLLFLPPKGQRNGQVTARDDDARAMAKELKTKAKRGQDGMDYVSFTAVGLDAVCDKLYRAGRKPALCEFDGADTLVNDWVPPEARAEAPTRNGAAPAVKARPSGPSKGSRIPTAK